MTRPYFIPAIVGCILLLQLGCISLASASKIEAVAQAVSTAATLSEFSASSAATVAGFNQPAHEEPFLFDSGLADIQWASDQTLFMLSSEGRVYRSKNHGRSWEDQSANMKSAGVKIHGFRISKVNKAFIFFIGEGSHHVATTDMGETYFRVDHPLVDIRLHNTNPQWILGSAMTPGCGRPVHESDPKNDESAMEKLTSHCFKQLYHSSDFGRTWHHLADYVAQYDWAPLLVNPAPGNDAHKANTIIYASIHRDKSGSQVFGRWSKDIDFVVSYDLFKSEPTVLVEHGNRFLFGDNNFLFVAQVDPDHESAVHLQVSKTNTIQKHFQPAVLEADLSEHSYTILDSSEDVVFLHVNHRPVGEASPAGHLYTSDSSGIEYALTLPFNHRNEEGKCDFAKLEALEGVFLANFVDEAAPQTQIEQDTNEMAMDLHKRESGGVVRKTLKIGTLITFNKGGDWSYLRRPRADANGNTYECNTKDCHLHLNGVTSTYGPFYSVSSAPGLILATGSVSKHLSNVPGLINTYFSRDGGLTWEEVAKGSHIYEISNHGALLVMIKDQEATNKLLYSWDQGREWHEYVFSKTSINVQNVITDPASTSQHFIVYGMSESGSQAVSVFVDFAILHQSKCQGIDAPGTTHSHFELWSPTDGRTSGRCLMGHTTTYVRRKQLAQCFIDRAIPPPRITSNCPCTIHDFECDAGYIRNQESGLCEINKESGLANKLSAAEAHNKCATQTHYRVTKGYRRVPGNTCVGGHEWEAVVAPCPSGWLSSSHTPVTLLLLVIIVAFGIIFLFQFEASDKWMARIKALFDSFTNNMNSGAYIRVNGGNSSSGAGGRGAPPSMSDDDGLSLTDKDIDGSDLPSTGGSIILGTKNNTSINKNNRGDDTDDLALDSDSDNNSKRETTIPAFIAPTSSSTSVIAHPSTIPKVPLPTLEPPPE